MPNGNHGQIISKGIRRRLIYSAIFGVFFLSILLAVPKLRFAFDSITDMNPYWLAFAVFLEVLSCVGYIVVFLRIFRRLPAHFGAKVALSELAFGGAVSLGGAGSLVAGGWIMVDRGLPVKRVTSRSLVLFLYTSAINVFTLVLASLGMLTRILPGSKRLELSVVPLLFGMGVIVFGFALPHISTRLARMNQKNRVIKFLCRVSRPVQETIDLLRKPGWHTVGAIGYLWFDIGVLLTCFAASGHVPPLLDVVLAYQLGLLTSFVPIPGGIGTLDAGIVGMMVLYGIAFHLALPATLVFHAIMLLLPMVAGVAAYTMLMRDRNEPLELKAATK